MENSTSHIDSESSKPIEVSFELSLKEILRGHFFTLIKSPYILVLLFLLAVFIVYQYTNGAFINKYKNLNQLAIYIPTLLPILIILLILFIITPYSRYKDAKKRLLLNRTYKFTDQEMIVENINIAEQIKWALIIKAVETPYDFLIFPEKAMAHLIPKTSFKNTEDLNKLRGLLRGKLGSKAKVKNKPLTLFQSCIIIFSASRIFILFLVIISDFC